LPEGLAKLPWAGSGAGDLIFDISEPLWSSGKKKALDVEGPSSSLKGSILFLESPSREHPEFDRRYLFLGVEKEAAKLRRAGVVC
jgi:hypothetical protein